MRAVIRRGQSLVVEDVADPVPENGQVLVKTLACGICGSDLHALHHLERSTEIAERLGSPIRIDPACDLIFGHEYCTEILDHGPATRASLPAGTRVVSMPFAFSGGSPEVIGFSNRFNGGYAEQMVLTEDLLIPVPDHISSASAALAEPLAVALHAVRQADLTSAVSLVIGCGPVGLAVIAMLRQAGAGTIVACDFSAARRDCAGRLGADVLVDPAKESAHRHWADFGVPHDLTAIMLARAGDKPYRRAVVFECVGLPGVIQSIVEGAPPESQIIVAGVCLEPDSFEPVMAINKELSLRFVNFYSADEFAAAFDSIATAKVDTAPFLGDPLSLTDVPALFSSVGSGAFVKPMIQFA